MFNAFIPFARGQLNITNLNVVLEIQPGFHAQFITGPLGHQPHGFNRVFTRFTCLWYTGAWRFVTQGFDRLFGACCGISQNRRKGQFPVRRSRRCHKAFTVLIRWAAVQIRAEHHRLIIPVQLATAMRIEVNNRRPTARHGDGVTCDFLKHTARTRLRTDGNPCHTLATLDLGNRFTILNADAHFAGCVAQTACAICAGVQNYRHVQSRLFQCNRRAIGIIVVCDNNSAIANRNTPVHNVITHGRGQHDPRNVIARKTKRAFNRPCGGNDLTRTNAP